MFLRIFTSFVSNTVDHAFTSSIERSTSDTYADNEAIALPDDSNASERARSASSSSSFRILSKLEIPSVVA